MKLRESAAALDELLAVLSVLHHLNHPDGNFAQDVPALSTIC